MFLISRTFSRQHPFPLLGVRPAIASMDASVVPATKVETLFKECPAGSNNRIEYSLSDGEQGWYKITTSAEPWQQGVSAQTGGVGGAKEYITYLCPGTAFTMWNSYKGGVDTLDGNINAAWGGSGARADGLKQGGAGAGSGFGGTTTVGSTSISGGAGFIAYLTRNQEPTYNAGTPIEIKTMQGYSNNPSLVYLQEDGNPITLTRTPTSDSDNGYAWTGFIPDPQSSTGATLAVTAFTPKHIASVGMRLVVYLTSDQVNPIQITIVAETTKTTYFMQETNPNNILQGYPVLTTTCVEVGRAGEITTAFGVKGFVFNGATYYYDEDAKASYSQQVYYAWRVPIHPLTGVTPGSMTRILYTNSATATTYFGANGVFAYELVKGKLCICGRPSISTGYAQQRVPELDMTGPRVVFGVTGANTNIWRKQNFTHTMTGCYFRLLAGGGGNMANYSASAMRGGCALGTPLKGTGVFFNNEDTWICKEGPAGAFGATHAQTGAWCVVDGNDTVALHGEGGGSSTVGSSTTKIYKLSDSTDVTKYAQRIYYPASAQDYTATLTVNDVVVDTITIDKSIYQTERFLQDVKQGDVLIIRLTGDNGSVENYIYTITTETLAFGLVLGAEPWKIREYTETGDHVLGMSPGSYVAVLVSGGGAGGSPSIAGGTHSVNFGGRGGSSVPRTIRFTNNDTQVATVKVGKGATSDAGAGAGGTSYNSGGSRPGISGGGAGQPTMVTFEKDVTVESMPIRLYSFTNGSTVYYTQNSYPNTNGMLTRFCDENGELNGLTAYKSYNGTTYGLTCQQDGKFYMNVSQTGNPNIDIDYSGLTRCIFNVSPGGGGGSGGASHSHRYGSGAGGGGGGGWYRIDMYNKYYYAVPGAAGGGAVAQAQAGHGGSGNRMDGYSITAFRGQNGANSTGGNGGTGYGSGGGAGGYGNANSSSAFCGAGGGGAPGNELGGWGGYNNGSSYNDAIAKTETLWGKPTEYGKGGNGYYGNSQPASYYSGKDGYAFLYRFEDVTQTIDCGDIEGTIDETIDCGSIISARPVTETIDCDLI